MTLDELIDKLQKIRELNPTDIKIENEISWMPCELAVNDNDTVYLEIQIKYKLPYYKSGRLE